MINTQETDVYLLEAEFYSKPFYCSYSSANILHEAPSRFYKEYVLKDKEDQVAKYLLEGVLIHYLVLDGLDFDSKFIVAPESLPSESSMDIINNVYKIHCRQDDNTLGLLDYEDQILEKLKEKNLHQRLKEDTQRIQKIADQKGTDYFNFLKTKGKRTIIDSAMLDKCSRRAEIVKADECVRKIIGLDMNHDGSKIGIYNELELLMEPDKYPFGFKGIIDNLVVDVASGTVTINDFKTTSKSLKDFTDSVEYWNYWLQAAFYKMLVKDFLKDVIKDDWIIQFNFVVFDRYDQLYIFPVTGITMADWESKAETFITQIKYHYENKEFKLPYAFAHGNIKL